MPETTLRAFIALPLPDSVKALLGQVQQDLSLHAGDGAVKWVDPQGLHLTLKFLGGVPVSGVAPIAQALQRIGAEVAPFELWLATLGAFPNLRQPRVVWVGATGALECLAALHQRIEEALAALGHSRETRPLSPHITLGRVPERTPREVQRRLGEALAQRTPLSERPPVPAEQVILYQSTLTPRGAIYTPLAVAALGGSVANAAH